MLKDWFEQNERVNQLLNGNDYNQYIENFLKDIYQSDNNTTKKIEEEYRFEIVNSLFPMVYNEDYHALGLMIVTFPSLPNIANRYTEDDKLTIVGYAMELRKVKMIEFLLSKGFDPDLYSDNEYSLEWAFEANDEQLIGILLKYNAFIFSGDLIVEALRFGKECFLQCIDVAKKTEISSEKLQDKLNYALVEFVKNGTEYAVEKLIISGADVNYIDASGNTPLNYASNTRVKEILLHYGGEYGDPDLIKLCNFSAVCIDDEEEQNCIEELKKFENLEYAMKKFKQVFQRSFASDFIATHHILIVDHLVNTVSDISVISYDSIFEHLFSTWRLFSGYQYDSKETFEEDVRLRFSVAKNLVNKGCKVEISPLMNFCQLKERQKEIFEDYKELFVPIINFFCEQNCDINELCAGNSLSYWALVNWNMNCLSVLTKFKPRITCKEKSVPVIDMLDLMLSDEGISRKLNEKLNSNIDNSAYSETQKRLIKKLYSQYVAKEDQKNIKLKQLLDLAIKLDGFDLNSCDSDGNSALHHICLKSHPQDIKARVTILIDCGINVNIYNRSGKRAYDIAKERGCDSETLSFLK